MIFLLLLFTVLSCNTKNGDDKDHVTNDNTPGINKADVKPATLEFWNKLKALEGKAFEGKLASIPANDDFTGKRLVMHVLYADDDKILIPFNVGENRSRTWIFRYLHGRIELKHDHRHQDGSNDEITMYGGTTANSGSSDMQVFPADEETVDMIPAAFSNAWWVSINDSIYTYNLRRLSTDRVFTVIFDLSKEAEKPAPSWGWENFNPNF